MARKNRVKLHASYLHRLCKSNVKDRKVLINKATGEQIRSICELCLNLNNRNIPVSNSQKTKLLRHKAVIQKLCLRAPIKSKKKYLCQKGGFLPALVPVLATIVGGLVGRWLEK